jgi:hypothetical protein
MPNSHHDITAALTHRVRDIFNKVSGQCQRSVACEMSTLQIENAYYH